MAMRLGAQACKPSVGLGRLHSRLEDVRNLPTFPGTYFFGSQGLYTLYYIVGTWKTAESEPVLLGFRCMMYVFVCVCVRVCVIVFQLQSHV